MFNHLYMVFYYRGKEKRPAGCRECSGCIQAFYYLFVAKNNVLPVVVSVVVVSKLFIICSWQRITSCRCSGCIQAPSPMVNKNLIASWRSTLVVTLVLPLLLIIGKR